MRSVVGSKITTEYTEQTDKTQTRMPQGLFCREQIFGALRRWEFENSICRGNMSTCTAYRHFHQGIRSHSKSAACDGSDLHPGDPFVLPLKIQFKSTPRPHASKLAACPFELSFGFGISFYTARARICVGLTFSPDSLPQTIDIPVDMYARTFSLPETPRRLR